jgi:hypothetical protein
MPCLTRHRVMQSTLPVLPGDSRFRPFSSGLPVSRYFLPVACFNCYEVMKYFPGSNIRQEIVIVWKSLVFKLKLTLWTTSVWLFIHFRTISDKYVTVRIWDVTISCRVSIKINFKNSLIIQEENTKKNHKRVVVLYVIKNHVNLHKL